MTQRFVHPMIDDWRVTTVEDYLAFDSRDVVKTLLEPCKNIMVFAMSFPKEEVAFKGPGYGLIARYAYGIDYHRLLEPSMRFIADGLREKGAYAYFQVDKGALNERFVASIAGLGYLGKNQFLIHPHFGTYITLGIVATSAEVSREGYAKDTCGTCRRCIDACPTGALNDGFNARLCTSHVTQMKAPFNDDDIKVLNRKVFGCDICQQVCPKNANITSVNRLETEADENSQLHLETLLSQSNKQIAKTYAECAFAFRGGLVLKRNAFALLVNQGHTRAYPLMQQVYEQYKHVQWFEPTAKKLLKRVAKKI